MSQDKPETQADGLPGEEGQVPVTHPDTRPEYVDFDVDDFPGGLAGCLEAILMATDQPLTSQDFSRVLAVEPNQAQTALQALAESYQGRGFELRETTRGWQLDSRPDYQPVVAAFVKDGQTARLSQAALEALAIVAYRQPMTRSEVGQIRGVNSDGVIRSLLVRGLVREDGVDPDTHAARLVTTSIFLEKMGLNSLEELPSLAPFLPDEESVLAQVQEALPQGADQVVSAQGEGLRGPVSKDD